VVSCPPGVDKNHFESGRIGQLSFTHFRAWIRAGRGTDRFEANLTTEKPEIKRPRSVEVFVIPESGSIPVGPAPKLVPEVVTFKNKQTGKMDRPHR
jgi:hypothetical protein